jgi:hypothetical protein
MTHKGIHHRISAKCLSTLKIVPRIGATVTTLYLKSVQQRLRRNLVAIRRALEDAGIEFIPANKSGKGVGVRLREE